MSKQRKARKRSPQAARRAFAVRLSQCMIVKNEEKNIERALSWAKDIAFEQIVVDTGSTDRTVEIAESMGATVYHFAWIDDFSAAKNFAIEQATGNWIAFLDADEYLNAEDTAKLTPLIEQVWRDPKLKDTVAISTPLANLNDAGNVFGTATQQRFFRNLPAVRYVNKIHEYLALGDGLSFFIGAITILHTGYAASQLSGQDKAGRNVAMLRRELAEHPDDANIKGYLADSLKVDVANPESLNEADALYQEVVDSGQPLNEVVARSSYTYLAVKAVEKRRYGDAIDLCTRAVKLITNSPDFYYWHAYSLYEMGNYDAAWSIFETCEKTIEGHILTNFNEETVKKLFRFMAQTALRREDWRNGYKYVTLALTQEKYQEDLLSAFLIIFRAMFNVDDKGIVEYLGKFYDFNEPKDKLFLSKCAKNAKDEVLMIFFYRSITEEDKAALAEVQQ
jgi:glycosyltransferase involved in cell wall biosynthesis